MMDDSPIEQAVDMHEDVFEQVSEVISSLESHPDPVVRGQVESLLNGIDAVHRTALTHMFQVIQGLGGETFINKLTADPAIRVLLMSYDLLTVDRRIHTEEALDAVRGHLHSHGVDVELLDVAGSEVFVRLHGLDQGSLPVDAVRRDIETALKDGLIGFQILTVGARNPPTPPAELIQLGGLRGMNRPVYQTAFPASDLQHGEIRAVENSAEPMLIANVAGDLYALADRCGDSPLPLSFSTLEDAVLVCSWHGCRYDVRSGARVDASGGDRIRVYPVRIVDGNVEIAVGVERVDRSPASSAEAVEPA